MTITIRAATADDARLLAVLNHEVQRLHAELEPDLFRSDTDNEQVAAFFTAKLALPENQIRIAVTGAGPAGYVWFEIQDRPPSAFHKPRKRIHIHHLSVQANARRRGVASALLEHVQQAALAGDVRSITLDAWAANLPARAFFSARGFAPFSFSFGKRLP